MKITKKLKYKRCFPYPTAIYDDTILLRLYRWKNHQIFLQETREMSLMYSIS